MKEADLLREMGRFARTGLPLTKGLESLIPDLPNKLRRLATTWLTALEEGRPLSAALARTPSAMGPGGLALVEAGEASGRLGESLEILAGESARLERRLSRLATALVYPIVLLHAAAVIPALGIAYQEGPLKALAGALLVLAPFYLAAAAFYALFFWRQRPECFSSGADRILAVLPVAGPALRRAALARWSRLLAGLMEAGVRLETALAQAATACGNSVVSSELGRRAPLILEGRTVVEILRDARVADARDLATLQAGETSGTLTEALRQTAEQCEFQSEQSFDRLAAATPLFCYFIAVVLVVMQVLRILAPLVSTYRELEL
ncbi:MAG: type II secretion system F family protein [Candidatus Methylacidiphilales bacterium]|nr:type II secretion system F family protein [Candidatus Methylacidiphilales bacterium]